MSSDERMLFGCGVALIILAHLPGCAPASPAPERADGVVELADDGETVSDEFVSGTARSS